MFPAWIEAKGQATEQRARLLRDSCRDECSVLFPDCHSHQQYNCPYGDWNKHVDELRNDGVCTHHPCVNIVNTEVCCTLLQEPIMQSSTGSPHQLGATTLADELHLASLPFACNQGKLASPTFLRHETLDGGDSTGRATVISRCKDGRAPAHSIAAFRPLICRVVCLCSTGTCYAIGHSKGDGGLC